MKQKQRTGLYESLAIIDISGKVAKANVGGEFYLLPMRDPQDISDYRYRIWPHGTQIEFFSQLERHGFRHEEESLYEMENEYVGVSHSDEDIIVEKKEQ